MSSFITLGAALLYVVPVFLLIAMQWERKRPLWAFALDIPVALASDLLLQLTLARVMRLQLAVIVSRVAWFLVALGVIIWRRKRLACPRMIGIRSLGAVAVSVGLAVALSMVISRACHIADRATHIPLVSSLRGQTVPFHDVYQPDVRLEYHYTGDVVAAAVQSLSFGHMHSSLALSVAHDILFGLCAAATALLVRALGVRSVLLTVLAALAPLLSGPMTAPFVPQNHDYRGYNFINFYHLSFRPACALAALFIVGFVGAALIGLSKSNAAGSWRTRIALVVCTAALTLTDEASTGILGLIVGAAWIFEPRVVHPRRLVGVGVFLALLVALVVPHFAFGGTLAPGSLKQTAMWVPLQAPGYFHPEVRLSSAKGVSVLFKDFLPLLLILAAVGVSAVGTRRRSHWVLAGAFAVMFGVTLLVICAIEIRADVPVPGGGFAGQNHRFITALLISAPLFFAACVVRRSVRTRLWILIPALVLGFASLTLSGGSTAGWIASGSKASCTQPDRYYSRDDFFSVDCKRNAASRAMGEPSRATYGAASILYVYAGCNSSYLSGPKNITYRMKIGLALAGKEALADVNGFIPEAASLRAVCPSLPSYPSDAVCTYAVEHALCSPSGDKILSCDLSPTDRSALLQGKN